MANITLTIPDDIVPDVVAALRAHYGKAGGTNRELLVEHLRQTVGTIYRAYKRTNDAAVKSAKATLDATIATKATEESVAWQTFRDAEAATDLAAKTAIAGVN